MKTVKTQINKFVIIILLLLIATLNIFSGFYKFPDYEVYNISNSKLSKNNDTLFVYKDRLYNKNKNYYLKLYNIRGLTDSTLCYNENDTLISNFIYGQTLIGLDYSIAISTAGTEDLRIKEQFHVIGNKILKLDVDEHFNSNFITIDDTVIYTNYLYDSLKDTYSRLFNIKENKIINNQIFVITNRISIFQPNNNRICLVIDKKVIDSLEYNDKSSKSKLFNINNNWITMLVPKADTTTFKSHYYNLKVFRIEESGFVDFSNEKQYMKYFHDNNIELKTLYTINIFPLLQIDRTLILVNRDPNSRYDVNYLYFDIDEKEFFSPYIIYGE